MSTDRWSARDRILVSLGVFAVALVVRLLHIWSIADAPWFAMRMGDAADHHALALSAAAGDWLGGADAGADVQTRRLYYHAPLYPYFLGVVYSIFGPGAMGVRVIQAVLGSLSCVFVAQAAGRLFTRREGVAAGALLALYGPAIFYDTIFQDPVLDLFFAALSLWAIVEVVRTRGRLALFLSGLALGAFKLTRENSIVLLVPLLAWIAFQRERSPRWRAGAAALVLAGVAVAMTPMAVRDAVLTGRFLPGDRLLLAVNLYIGNNPGADGYYRPIREGRGNPRYEMEDAIRLAERESGRELTLPEVSDHWLGQVLDYVRTQPLDWLALTARKAVLMVQTIEPGDMEDPYTYAERSPVLALTLPVLGFGSLLALAVLGVFMTWPQRRRLYLFHALPAVYLAALVAFLVFGRYRHPVTPFLVLFAAPALTTLPALVRERRRRAAAGVAAALAVLVVAHLPIGFTADRLRAHTHTNVGAGLQERGDVEGAARQYMRALEIEPEAARANQLLGTLLHRSGRPDMALPYLARAVDAAPQNPWILNDYGAALAALGLDDQARQHLERALALDPDLVQAHLNLGTIARRTTGAAAALEHFRRAAAADPEDPLPRRAMATTHALEGRADAARAQIDTLAALGHPDQAGRLLVDLARELAAERPPAERRPATALELLSDPPDFAPRDARYLRARAAALAGAGDFDAAIRDLQAALEGVRAGAPGEAGVTAADLEADLERYRSREPPP